MSNALLFYVFKSFKNTSGARLTRSKILAIFHRIKPYLVPNYFRIKLYG